MKQDKRNIDEIMKTNAGKWNQKPRAAAWDKLETILDAQEKASEKPASKRFFIGYKWMAAASFLIIFGVSLVFVKQQQEWNNIQERTIYKESKSAETMKVQPMETVISDDGNASNETDLNNDRDVVPAQVNKVKIPVELKEEIKEYVSSSEAKKRTVTADEISSKSKAERNNEMMGNDAMEPTLMEMEEVAIAEHSHEEKTPVEEIGNPKDVEENEVAYEEQSKESAEFSNAKKREKSSRPSEAPTEREMDSPEIRSKPSIFMDQSGISMSNVGIVESSLYENLPGIWHCETCKEIIVWGDQVNGEIQGLVYNIEDGDSVLIETIGLVFFSNNIELTFNEFTQNRSIRIQTNNNRANGKVFSSVGDELSIVFQTMFVPVNITITLEGKERVFTRLSDP